MAIPQISPVGRPPSVSGKVAGLSFVPSARVPEPGRMPVDTSIDTTPMAILQTVGSIAGNAANLLINIKKDQEKLYNATQYSEAVKKLNIGIITATEELKKDPMVMGNPMLMEPKLTDQISRLHGEINQTILKDVSEETRVNFLEKVNEKKTENFASSTQYATHVSLARAAGRFENDKFNWMDDVANGRKLPVDALSAYDEARLKLTGTVFDEEKSQADRLKFGYNLKHSYILNLIASNTELAITLLKTHGLSGFQDQNAVISLTPEEEAAYLKMAMNVQKNDESLANTMVHKLWENHISSHENTGSGNPQVDQILQSGAVKLNEGEKWSMGRDVDIASKVHTVGNQANDIPAGLGIGGSLGYRENGYREGLPLTPDARVENQMAQDRLYEKYQKPMEDALRETPIHPSDVATAAYLMASQNPNGTMNLLIGPAPKPDAPIEERIAYLEKIYNYMAVPKDQRRYMTNEEVRITTTGWSRIADPEARAITMAQDIRRIGQARFTQDMPAFNKMGMTVMDSALITMAYTGNLRGIDLLDKASKFYRANPKESEIYRKSEFLKAFNDKYRSIAMKMNFGAPAAYANQVEQFILWTAAAIPDGTPEEKVKVAWDAIIGEYGSEETIGNDKRFTTWAVNRTYITDEINLGADAVYAVSLTPKEIKDAASWSVGVSIPKGLPPEEVSKHAKNYPTSELARFAPVSRVGIALGPEDRTRQIQERYSFYLLDQEINQPRPANQLGGIWNGKFNAGDAYVLRDGDRNTVTNKKGEYFIIPIGRIPYMAKLGRDQSSRMGLTKEGREIVESIKEFVGIRGPIAGAQIYLHEKVKQGFETVFPWTR